MNDLFFKNGKAKKKYCLCLSREKIAELKQLYGYEIVQCAGCGCPYYAVGCGRRNLRENEQTGKALTSMGEELRAARKAAGLTQVELAEKVGCKQKDISRWEAGRPMTAATLKKLADALGCKMEDLI